ncbi:hypothetical protein QJQ45_005817 [Haematococcus lacustris]|nr:hypothetical protein QJQ45_005817 [Haematococcus lacustris]
MLQANGLKARLDKSLFGADVVEYLGHNVNSHGLSPTEAKVAAVTALPTPTCLHDLRQIMGFINHYRCYVPDYSAIAAPAKECHGLVTDHQPLTWLMTNPNLTGHRARRALSLQDYTFTIEHRPGNKHQNADVLSRWPLEASSDGTGAQLDLDPAAALASFPSPTAADPVVWACASY